MPSQDGAVSCPAVTVTDPALDIVFFESDRERTIEAGTRSAPVYTFEVVNLTDQDVEVAEWPQQFVAVMGSFLAPDGSPAFTNIRLIEEGRETLLGPEDIPASTVESAELLLWDALLLRAHRTFTFTLVMDVAPGVEGVFDITAGDACQFTPRAWFHNDMWPEPGSEIPLERIENNIPVTTRVIIASE